MATESDLNAMGVRIYNDVDALIVVAKALKAEGAPLVVASAQDRAAALAAAQRADEILAGMGGSSAKTVIALLHLSEVALGTRPATWVNSITSGPTFNNWGSNQQPGGASFSPVPFGTGMSAQGADGGTVAITSAAPVTFAGDFTLESIFAGVWDDNRNIFQISTDGTDTGAVRLYVGCRTDGGDGTKRVVCYAKNGSQNFEAFYSTPLQSATIGGVADAYHCVLQREANILTFRVNGQRVATAATPLTGAITGYLDLFGSYARAWGGAEGPYQMRVSELRASIGAIYSGATYPIPTARLTAAV